MHFSPTRKHQRSYIRIFSLAFFYLLFYPVATPAHAAEIRFDTRAQWASWSLPGNSVDISDGLVRPVAVSRNINAAANARRLGGGIRAAGTNQLQVIRLLDGDPTTGWQPEPNAPAEDRWFELDLGRAVSAHRIRLVFARDAPPMETFRVLLSTGEQALNVANTRVEGTLIYRLEERFKENTRHRVVWELDQPQHTPFQFIRFEAIQAPADARLVEVEVDALGDNLVLGMLDRGGALEIVVERQGSEAEALPLGNARSAIDGDLRTIWAHGSGSGGLTDTFARITLDLGAVFWVDWIRLVGRVVRGKGFNFGFYEVLTSDGSLAPDGTLIWDTRFADGASPLNQQQGWADHPFSVSPVRYVRIAWKFWDGSCGSALGAVTSSGRCANRGNTTEIQVYGAGFPNQTRLQSALLDLGGTQAINTLHWDGTTPPGTRIEIRSRSGDTLVDRLIYRDKDGKEITARRWERLIPSFRGPVDTLQQVGPDWSLWSVPYTQDAPAFLSPSPRRYAQLEARLISADPAAAPVLDALTLTFGEPLVDRTRAEVFPVDAQPGQQQRFTYFLRADRRPGNAGFDRVRLFSSAATQFIEVRLDSVQVPVTARVLEDGFELQFERVIDRSALVEIDFYGTLFRQARFDAFLSNSALPPSIRQQADAGDAAGAVASDGLTVALPLSDALLSRLDLSSRIITPNGDGLNDQLTLAFDLLEFSQPRPVEVSLYTLSGIRIRRLSQRLAIAGRQRLSWDGRDASGRLVAAGLYLLHIQASGDARAHTLTRLLSVAY